MHPLLGTSAMSVARSKQLQIHQLCRLQPCARSRTSLRVAATAAAPLPRRQAPTRVLPLMAELMLVEAKMTTLERLFGRTGMIGFGVAAAAELLMPATGLFSDLSLLTSLTSHSRSSGSISRVKLDSALDALMESVFSQGFLALAFPLEAEEPGASRDPYLSGPEDGGAAP